MARFRFSSWPAKIFPAVVISANAFLSSHAQSIPVDLSKYDPASLVRVHQDGDTLNLRWQAEEFGGGGKGGALRHARGIKEHGEFILNLAPDQPLIRRIGIAPNESAPAKTILQDIEPVTIVTVGERNLERRSGWTIFFDKVHKRPHTTHLARLELSSVQVESVQRSVRVRLDGLSAGPFKGELVFNLYPACRLIHVEAVLSTDEDRRAIVYDAGIVSGTPGWNKTVWRDTAGQRQSADGFSEQSARPLALKHRVIAVENANGSLGVFPAPHKYFYPIDFANNFKFAWLGRDYRGLAKGHGFGFRQPLDGDNRFVPWFNAPPGTKQRLSAFYIISSGSGQDAIDAAKRYTRDDTFKPLKGHRTFTSHYHVEHTLEYLRRQQEQGTSGIPEGLEEPGFVKTFKDMGVEIVHLAEFHNGRTPRLKTPERLKQLKLMHDECERLSTRRFLLLPGEEPNVHLGGHWISFFPRPVYWVLNRAKGAPFATKHDGIGTVYHVGNAADVLELFKREKGLNWTAHPRIKGSTGFPDAYAKKDYYLSDTFLGAAWKSMPADLSDPRLGTRVLDLQDDMLNWGQKKYILGEVDVFKIEPDYELYGHMNVNYLRLDRIPRYKDGWQPVLDCLSEGKYFVTTGEILIEDFTINGKRSGETAKRSGDDAIEFGVVIDPTFPLASMRLIGGNGRTTRAWEWPMALQAPFSRFRVKALKHPIGKFKGWGARWIRLEVWDIAGNGAFTPPVWIEN